MIRLKELREARGWGMREASRFLGKSYTTYVNHEKGYREPNSEDLKAYAAAYGVTIDYLIGRTSTAENKPEDELLALFAILNEQGQRVAVAQIRALTNLPEFTQKSGAICETA